LLSDRTLIVVSLDSLGGREVRKVNGSILVKITDTTTALQRGDRVEFTAYLYPIAPGKVRTGFDRRHYLNLKGIFGTTYLPNALKVRVDRRNRFGLFHVIDRLRDAIRGSLYRNLTKPQSALAAGFLIGETRDIPGPVYKMFRDSGTLHLLAVSGSNVALILIFITFVIRPFKWSRPRRAIILLLVILVFAELSYEEPSVIRASVMAALVILAQLIQRRYDLNNVIACAAVMILLVSPGQLYDVGFRLSFVTAWGLIFILPKLDRLLNRYHNRRWYRWLIFPLMVSVVAQVVSTPVIAYHFGQVPAISVLANLIIVPLVSISVIGILILLVADLIWPLLGIFVGSLLNLVLGSVVQALQLLGGDRMPVIKTAALLPEGLWGVVTVAAYLLIIGLILSLAAVRARKAILFGVIGAVNIFLLFGAVHGRQSDQWTIHFTTVPGGVAALVSQPSGGVSDLILTGLQASEYQIDTSILGPWLAAKGVNRLHAIFVLSAEYGAIDDCLRLGAVYRADTVTFPATLRHSVADVVLPDSSLTCVSNHLCYFSMQSDQTPDGNGCYAGKSGVLVRLEGGIVLLTDHLEECHLDRAPAPRATTLVVGRKWRPTAAEWSDFYDRGYAGIICSKIEPHVATDTYERDFASGSLLPDYLHDLNRLGDIRLRVTAEGPVIDR
jgi:ComEC/Rec2-related protein